MVKKKKELKPEILHKDTQISKEDLFELAEKIDKFDFEPAQKDDTETFYKLAIRELFNDKNIEQKTEWLNTAEVFSATKLVFLGKYGDIPLAEEFISALEKKRVSLLRKGREEIVLSLQERKQEELELRKNQLMQLGLMGAR